MKVVQVTPAVVDTAPPVRLNVRLPVPVAVVNCKVGLLAAAIAIDPPLVDTEAVEPACPLISIPVPPPTPLILIADAPPALRALAVPKTTNEVLIFQALPELTVSVKPLPIWTD